MQTLERPEIQPRTTRRSKKLGGRRPFPGKLLLIAVACALVIAVFGAPGALILIGLAGFVGGFVLSPGVEKRSGRMGRVLWLGATLLFALSFVVSGATHAVAGVSGAEPAAIELRRTLFAAALFGIVRLGLSGVRFRD